MITSKNLLKIANSQQPTANKKRPAEKSHASRQKFLAWIYWLFPIIYCLLFIIGCAQNPNYVKGQALARQGQWEEAVASLQEAVRAEPKNTKYQRELAAAQKALANHYNSLGQKILKAPELESSQTLLAKSYFQKALEQEPRHKEAKEGLARSVLLAEALQKAREEAFANAKKAQSEGDWVSAREEFQKALRLDASYLPAREGLLFTEKMLSVETFLKEAKRAETEGDKKKAKELYSRAAALLPEYGPVQEAYQKLEQEEKRELAWQRLTLGQLLIKNKRWEEAQRVLEEAQKLDEQSPKIKNTLYAVKMKRVEDWVAQGDKLFAAKKFLEALNFYRQALTIIPDYKGAVDGLDFAVGALAEAHYQRAKAYQQRGLWGNAAAELKICQSWVPHYKDSQEILALMGIKIKESLPAPKGERLSAGGISEVVGQPLLFEAKEWEDKGDKERAVEEYCRVMSEDSRLNLWPKIFELKGFDPEKTKQILAPDSF